MKRLTGVLAVALTLLASCAGSGKGVLEHGGPRIADDSGVVTDATLERIQLDHKRSYLIGEKVESFNSGSHAVRSLLSWEGQFVQVGLSSDKKAKWIAGIGTVVQGPPPLVFFTGTVDHVDRAKRYIYFDDGTVLVTERGVHVPSKGQIVCQIDPAQKVVTKITPG